MMDIEIQFVNMDTSESFDTYARKKLNKLNNKYESIIRAQVYIKMENDPKGLGHICDIELSLSGPRIFASSNEKNYELALKNTIGDLEDQLEKRKGKIKPYL